MQEVGVAHVVQIIKPTKRKLLEKIQALSLMKIPHAPPAMHFSTFNGKTSLALAVNHLSETPSSGIEDLDIVEFLELCFGTLPFPSLAEMVIS